MREKMEDIVDRKLLKWFSQAERMSGDKKRLNQAMRVHHTHTDCGVKKSVFFLYMHYISILKF